MIGAFSVQILTYGVLICLLVGLSVVDLKTNTIPNKFIVAGIMLWLLSVWFIDTDPDTLGVGSSFVFALGYGTAAVIVDGVVGAVVIGGGVLIFALVFDKITGRKSLGGGDVKLFFMVSLFLGLGLGVVNLLLSCVIGVVFSLFWGLFRRGKNREEGEKEKFSKQAFPFGPAIAASTIITLFAGQTLLAAYLGV